MAKAVKKKTRLGVIDIVLMAVAAVGLALTIVGVCIPFFSQVSEGFGESSTESYGLFADFEWREGVMGDDLKFGIEVVQAFALLSLIFAAIACAVLVLGKLGILKLNGLFRIILAAVGLVMAALSITFAAVYAGQFGGIDAGDFGGTDFIAAAGAYLVMAGGIVSNLALLVGKTK